MKKNRMMRLASVLLVCVLLTTSVISGTFAKYTSEGSVTDTARVAKWDIKLEGATITKDVTIDLFATAYKNPAGTETTVQSDTTENVIAPGTEGFFEIDLKNDSEVAAEYAISYTINNAAGVPIEFSLTGNDDDWTSTIADLNCEKQPLAMDATASTVTVYWKWVFNPAVPRTDADDTYLGTLDTLPTVSVTATITVDQVD